MSKWRKLRSPKSTLELRWRDVRPLRVLDFDLENRPLSYAGMDWTSAEITAMAWSWVGSGKVESLVLDRDGKYSPDRGPNVDLSATLVRLRTEIESADIVTGHYIRKHDLPLLNAALMEAGERPLNRLLVQDTKTDLVQRKDLSASQENLAAMFGLDEDKAHMNQAQWREANRLTDEGMALTRVRVTSDVAQHIALRYQLLERQLLNPPRRWNP